MKDIIEELYLTNRGFVTDEYDQCLDYINEHELDLQYHKYDSGTRIWDSWIIPDRWHVNEAYIEHNGGRILDYADHPLHLISYSSAFEGWVSREELKNHIYTHSEIHNAIPWHFRLNYRPWESKWGFCASQNFVDSLDRNEYYVCIDTTFEADEMTVAEHHLPGNSEETILLIAHLDHTGMANDDLSGVAVGIELMRRLQRQTERQYSYKLLLVQEMLGSAAYLEEHADHATQFEFGIFLEMLGNNNRLLLQETFDGTSRLDSIAKHELSWSADEYEIRTFRELIGNDELIFESPGYEIPTISVSRFPYPEYHTHLDNPDLISEQQLEESLTYLERIVNVLETDFVPIREFSGLPSLANPKYDLYIDPGQSALEGETTQKNLKLFSERVFRYLDGDHSAFEIAETFDLDFKYVSDYLSSFEEKGLVTTIPVESGRSE